ncbi:MAG: Do family serine endopeptidase [Burkholderiaceae bacterium]
MKTTTTILALATASAFTAGAFIASASSAVGTPPEVRASVESSVNAEAGHAVIAATTAPDYRAIVQQYGPAVVGITVEGKVATAPDFARDPFFRFYRGLPIPPMPNGEVPMHGQGSGFIVDADGLILTNAHVVRDASTVTVKLADRREFEARVLGVDPATDVAVLKIEASGLPTVALGDPSRLAVGDPVLAIGSPFGFEQSATAGIVSAKGRSLPGDTYVPFIQTDVAVNPGNSGGPLFDRDGKVVGINSQIWSRTGGYQGLSFAIPIDVAANVRDQIVTTGAVRHARLGITVQEMNQALAESFGLEKPSGALVTEVATGSPAETAGLQAGDVVLAMNGKKLEHSTELAARIGQSDPGEPVKLVVLREGKHLPIHAMLGEVPAPRASAADHDEQAGPGRLGLAVRPLVPDEKQATGLPGGLVVEGVAGAAQRAGIEPGDVILSVNGRQVNSVEQLRKTADGSQRRLALLVLREGGRIFIPVTLG